jgi:hypothetical protein
MNFFFCERCGKRITEADLAEGLAKDKQLKGVYCKGCATGVLTMTAAAVTPAEVARAAGEKAAPPSAAGEPARASPVHKPAAAARAAHPPAPRSRPSFIAPVLAGVVAAGVVVALYLATAGPTPTGRGAAVPARPPPASPVNPPAATGPGGAPASKPPPVPDTRENRPPDAPPHTLALEAEDRARTAYDALVASWKTLAAADVAARKAAAESFLKEHGDSMQAARVRVLLTELAAKTTPPPEPAPPVTPPAGDTVKTPAEASTAKPAETAATKAAPPPERAPAAGWPPILSEAQQGTLALLDESFALLAKSQAKAALARARKESSPEAQALARLLERVEALRRRAVEELTRRPPDEPVRVTVNKMELTGKLTRIDGGRAWIRAKDLELPVDVSELPRDVLLKALDLTGADGEADRAAFLFATGDVDGAVALLPKLDKEKNRELAALVETRAQFNVRRRFAKAVADVEAAIARVDAKSAVEQWEALPRSFAELVNGEQKGRVEQLGARARGQTPAGLLRRAFSGEVLKAEDDYYVEVRYEAGRGQGVWRDFRLGKNWSLDANGISSSWEGREEGEDLVYLPRFRMEALRAELVLQSPRLDYVILHLGYAHAKARWLDAGQLIMTYEPKFSKHFLDGHEWKYPARDGTHRCILERTPEKARFLIGDTPHDELSLARDAVKQEPAGSLGLFSYGGLTVKEVLVKGFADEEWLKKRMAEGLVINAR